MVSGGVGSILHITGIGHPDVGGELVVSASPAEGRQVMQKWEYKAIVEKTHQKAEVAMNNAGEEGWEAFAGAIWGFATGGFKDGSHLIWLKRPKPA